MVLDVVLFLWNKVKLVVQGDEIQNPTFTYSTEKIDHFEKVCIYNPVAKTDSCNQFIFTQLDNWMFLYDLVVSRFDNVLQVFHSLCSVLWYHIIAVALVSLRTV